MYKVNSILRTDSYKTGHWAFYPQGVDYITSYLTARGGPFVDVEFFGLQAIIEDYLMDRVTEDDVKEAQEFTAAHGVPFNYVGWMGIVKDFGGYLPIEILAVPEGSHVKYGDPLVVIRNTAPGYGWLSSYVETVLMRVWYPTTVATLSRRIKTDLQMWAAQMSDDPNSILFRLHDFGARGVSSGQSAQMGGMGHLVNFLGSDNMEAVMAARHYYGEPMAGYSVIATEHSTMTMWGEEGEFDAFKLMIEKYGAPGKIISIVSDSWNIDRVLREYLPRLKDLILSKGCIVVVRLDSGDPVEQVMNALNLLRKTFGYTRNSKNYIVLSPCVRILQGDGIDRDMVNTILREMDLFEWSVDNIVFGMGGALLQKVNRDTLKFAYKACLGEFEDGEARQVHKRSEDAWKASKTYAELDLTNLHGVFLNGEFTKRYTFAEIRERAEAV